MDVIVGVAGGGVGVVGLAGCDWGARLFLWRGAVVEAGVVGTPVGIAGISVTTEGTSVGITGTWVGTTGISVGITGISVGTKGTSVGTTGISVGGSVAAGWVASIVLSGVACCAMTFGTKSSPISTVITSHVPTYDMYFFMFQFPHS